MIEDVAWLREQAQKARRLAHTFSDNTTKADLEAYAVECEERADYLEAAQLAARDQPSRF